ncbi:hypothetical protein FRC02_003290 [Tulasnella sp. 418]|nr:hypothetical protein FRC02_003290 [Tulasnella sp. 418]
MSTEDSVIEVLRTASRSSARSIAESQSSSSSSNSNDASPLTCLPPVRYALRTGHTPHWEGETPSSVVPVGEPPCPMMFPMEGLWPRIGYIAPARGPTLAFLAPPVHIRVTSNPELVAPYTLLSDSCDPNVMSPHPSPDNASNPDRPFVAGRFGTVGRYNQNNTLVGEYYPVPHRSWYSRFAPMITDGNHISPNSLNSLRMRRRLFKHMNRRDWEIFANHVEMSGWRSPITLVLEDGRRFGAKEAHSLTYLALLFRVENASKEFVELCAARPSIIVQDLACRIKVAPVFRRKYVAQILQAISERFIAGITKKPVDDLCAGANWIFAYLTAIYGPAKHAHKRTVRTTLFNEVREIGVYIMTSRTNSLDDCGVAKACGMTIGMCLMGTFMYVNEQRSHGQRRNQWVENIADIAGSVVVAIINAALGDENRGTTVAVGAAGAVVTEAQASLVRQIINLVKPVIDWTGYVKYCADHLECTLQSLQGRPGLTEKQRKIIEQVRCGIIDSRRYIMSSFNHCEKKLANFNDPGRFNWLLRKGKKLARKLVQVITGLQTLSDDEGGWWKEASSGNDILGIPGEYTL